MTATDLTDRHLDVLNNAGRGFVWQRGAAIALTLSRERRAEPGYTQAAALAELIEGGYIEHPPRFARTLHRRCPVRLTARGRLAFEMNLTAKSTTLAKARADRHMCPEHHIPLRQVAKDHWYCPAAGCERQAWIVPPAGPKPPPDTSWIQTTDIRDGERPRKR